MKKVLRIIGIGLIVGAAVYELLNKKKKVKNNINTRPEKIPKVFSSGNTVSINDQIDIYDENADFEDVKASATGTMNARHKEASNIMKEAVDNIYSRSKISADENHNLDQLSNELEELLSEDKR